MSPLSNSMNTIGAAATGHDGRSGLLDIRMLSSALDAQRPAVASASASSIALPMFSRPWTMTELRPTPRSRHEAQAPAAPPGVDHHRVLSLMSVVLGIFVVALGAYVALRSPSPSPSSTTRVAAGAAAVPTVDETVTSAAARESVIEPDADVLIEPDVLATVGAEPVATVEPAAVVTKTAKRRTKRVRRSPRPKAKPPAKPLTGGAAAPTPVKEKSTLPVECVLDPRACGTGSASGLRATPSASQVRTAIAKVKPEAKRCGDDHGLAAGDKVRVKLSVEGTSGRVTSAKALGDHAGTAAGRCVARALAKATMPRFSKPTAGILYSVRM